MNGKLAHNNNIDGSKTDTTWLTVLLESVNFSRWQKRFCACKQDIAYSTNNVAIMSLYWNGFDVHVG